MRDLTLRSASSFGSFHLIRLLFDEYIFYLVENRVANTLGKTALEMIGNPSSAILASLSLSTPTDVNVSNVNNIEQRERGGEHNQRSSTSTNESLKAADGTQLSIDSLTRTPTNTVQRAESFDNTTTTTSVVEQTKSDASYATSTATSMMNESMCSMEASDSLSDSVAKH